VLQCLLREGEGVVEGVDSEGGRGEVERAAKFNEKLDEVFVVSTSSRSIQ